MLRRRFIAGGLMAIWVTIAIALPGSAEIKILLKDGRQVVLPYNAEDVDSITFSRPAKDKPKTAPKLPEPSVIVNPPMPKGQVGAAPASKAGGGEGGPRNWGDVRKAARAAEPGQVITIPPGTYIIGRNSVLGIGAHGTAEQPIVLRAEKLGTVTIEVEYPEASRIAGSYWIFENLEFLGICGSHSSCEHAFHLKPGSHHLVIRNNRMINFNAAIKGSARDAQGETGPSWITVEGNWIYNTTPRDTGTPVTPIDVNGGRNWVVRGNYIADFAKLRSDKVSYGAFLKRNSFDGLFEGNLIVCEQRHSGGVRLGLSLGGGGTRLPIEHTNGTIRNNIIMNCPRDVGIYLNRARNTRVYNNILYNTAGIDVRYRQSTAEIRNNVMSGRIKNRSDGSHSSEGNRVGVSDRQFEAWFENPKRGDFRPKPGAPVIGGGVAVPDVVRDFCGRNWSDKMDQGAIAAAGGPCPALEKLWVDK